MLFITLATLATSLSISINGNEFTGDTFDSILSNYGSGKSTIQSLIVNSGQFSLSYITTDFSQLSILHVPRESYIGEVPSGFLRKLKSLTEVQIDGATVINDQAFQSCSSLRTISFPLCEKINNYVFEYCTSLQDVTFKSCTDLGNYAFGYCSALSSINFPILNVLGYYSFIETALTSVELDTVTKASSYNTGSRQFSGCTKLTHVSMKSITYIASFMFIGCSKLSSYDFPSVTEIGVNAFSNCPSITSLNFPSLTKIDDYAFYGSNNFQKVDLPLVVQVCEKAFYKCVGLREVSLKSCTELGIYVFADCSALSSIDFPVLNSIGTLAFAYTALTEVELDTITTLNGNQQFSHCTKLTYISLKGVTILPNSMFDGCTQLSSYDFSSVIEIGTYVFKNCMSITTLDFPSLTKIGEGAFSRLNGIQEIDLPTVVTINEYAFQYCLNLKSVSLISCTTIFSYAFQYCSSLSSVNIPNLEGLGSFAFRSTAITKVQFDSLSTLSTYIFTSCSKLAQVSLRSTTTITKGLFEKCYQLRIVDIPLCQKIDQYGFNGCTNIGTLTIGFKTVNFEGIPAPSYLQKITFPYALSIERYALNGLTNLVYCNFPKVQIINSNEFEGLSRLVELETPSVTELKENAFTGCISLSSISLKSLLIVDSTSANIFKGCQNLKSLYLPDEPPKTFHKDTFKGMNCKIIIPLDAVSVYDNDESITGDKANDGFWCGIPLPSEKLTIKINNQKDTISGQQLSECFQISGISESLITSLEIVSGMIKLSTMIDSINKLPVLEDFIISDSVIIEDALTEGMFNKSPFLSLTIDTSIEKIPKNCFLDCSRIQKVKITKCKEIQDSAFKGCINLISVIINAETLSGDSHFEGCQSLTSVSLTHLKKVDPSSSKIFLNCPLNSLYFPSTPPSTFHPDTFNGRRILFFGLSSTELKNYDSNIEVAGDVANDYKWCGIDLFQIYVKVSFNGQKSVTSDSIQNAQNLAGVSYVETINIIGGYVTSTILNEIRGITYLENLKISDTAALESYIIGPEQFKDLSNLEYVEIMQDVSLSENCFMGCTSLIKAEFGSAKLLSEGCFRDCESLTSLIIPQCQELKGDYIFANCEKLTSIDISSLLYINNESENIFSGCINLEKIFLPSIEPTRFNKNSFKDCQELILVLPYSNDYTKYDDNSKVEDDVAEDDKWCGINFDPEKANQKMLHFKINDIEYKRRSFKNLPIKGSLSTINILEEEIELKSLELIRGSFEPNDLKKITSGSTTLEKFIAHEDTLKSILEMTFNGCSSLKEITILSDSEIEPNVFQNLPALTTLTLPMLKVVHSNEFEGDINLQNVSLPLVSSIPKNLFSSLEKLNTVDLSSVTILNDNCFYDCANLQRIYLPSVKKIFGDSHFSGCKNLELVFLPSLETVNPEGSLIFENCNSLVNLTLSNEPPSIFHKEIFKNAGTTPNIHLIDESGWKNYYKQCTIDPDTEKYNWYGFNLNIKREESEVSNKNVAPSKKGYSTGALVGAIIGTVIGSVAICVVIMLVIKKCKPGSKAPIENEP